MTFNESAFQIVNEVPMGAFNQFVTVDACKDYVASVARTNKIMMVVCGLGIVVMYIILHKTGYLKKEKENKE